MFTDAGNGSGKGLLEADICIVGSGPAGMTLARELASTQRRIIILESGDRSLSGPAEELNQGTVDSPQGYPTHVLQEGRRRQLGGSANLWNHEPRGQKEKFIRCLPLDEVDFEKRDWVPESGWPFSKGELVPYYERAQRVFNIGSFDYSSSKWQEENRPALETDVLHSTVSQFALPRCFLKDGVADLERAGNIRVLLRTHLLRLERDAGSERIVAAEVLQEGGGKLRIEAAVFILAAGGLENPRILLLNQDAQDGGLGNQNDMVGRCFMDHPSITLGTLHPSQPEFFERADFYDQHVVDGQPVMGKVQLRPEVVRQRKLLNLYAVLVPRFRNLRSNMPYIFKELLVKGPQFVSRHRASSSPALEALNYNMEPALSLRKRLLGGYFSECYCGWSKLTHKATHFGEFGVRALVELAPNRENRVMLGGETDRLGQTKAKIVWRWNELDLQSIRDTQEIFRSEFTEAGIGTFEPVAEGGKTLPRTFYSTHHFMGTTRMHDDPRQGVVDANGRVHGWKNLFIAGSSVFPTGGCANPTLTVVALAIRLADYLKDFF